MTIFLPGWKKLRPVGPIPTGTKVRLAACRDAEPGIVVGVKNGKVLVRWPEHFTGRHRADTLIAD